MKKKGIYVVGFSFFGNVIFDQNFSELSLLTYELLTYQSEYGYEY